MPPHNKGGGLYCDGAGSGNNCSPSLVNVSFTSNSADDAGGAMFNTGESGGTSTPSLVNVILWNNTAINNGAQLYNVSAIPVLSYTLIQTASGDIDNISGGNVTFGPGNISNQDPLFMNVAGADGITGTLDDNLQLNLTSPALDAGDNSVLSVDTDIRGHSRRVDVPSASDTGNGPAPLVDMGAYELDSFLLITPTDSLSTTEAGGTVVFSVTLSNQPGGSVAIAVSNSDSSEASIVGGLGFSTGDWNIPQVITITGEDDDLYDPNTVYTVTFDTSGSFDNTYAALTSQSVTLSNIDDEPLPSLNIYSTTLTTSETGNTAAFSLTLSVEPTAQVSVTLSSDNTNEGTFNTDAVYFTAGTWNIPQIVTVTGQDDAVYDPDTNYHISFETSTSAAPNFAALISQTLTLINQDDESPPNAAPTVSGLNVTPTIDEDSAITLTFTISDDYTALDSLVVAVLNNSNTDLLPNGNLDLSGSGANRSLSLSPATDQSGVATFTLRVSDGSLNTDMPLTLTVNAVNDGPVLVNPLPDQQAVASILFTYTIPLTTFNDVDDASLNISISNLPAWLSFNPASLTLSGTASLSDVGQIDLNVVATDAEALSTLATLSLDVVRDVPTFSVMPLTSASSDTPYLGIIVVENPLGLDGLVIEALQKPAWLSFTVTAPGQANLSGTPTLADVGTYLINLQAINANGISATHSYTLTVFDSVDAPEFTSTPVSTAQEDETYVYTITAESSLSDTVLNIYSLQKPSWLSLQNQGDGLALLTGTPTEGKDGSYNIHLVVEDEIGRLSEQTFNLQVEAVNDAPSFSSSPPETSFEGDLYSYLITTSDVDNLADVTISGNFPSWLSATANGQATLSGTPGPFNTGKQSITLFANDGALTATQSFSLNIVNVTPPFGTALAPCKPRKIVR